MKSFLTLVIILSASASAFADSSQFLPQRPVAPSLPAAKSDRMPSRYPAYNRATPRVEHAQPAQRANESARMPSRFRAYSRDYRS
jgi:hypothetical protein